MGKNVRLRRHAPHILGVCGGYNMHCTGYRQVYPFQGVRGGCLIGWKMRGLTTSLQKGERGRPNEVLTGSLSSGVYVVMELWEVPGLGKNCLLQHV